MQAEQWVNKMTKAADDEQTKAEGRPSRSVYAIKFSIKGCYFYVFLFQLYLFSIGLAWVPKYHANPRLDH